MKTKRGTRRISILLVIMIILSMTPIGMTQAQAVESDGHNYENGFCTDASCDYYQPAKDSNGDGFYEILNAGNLYWFIQQIDNGNTNINGKLINDIVINNGDENGKLYKIDESYYPYRDYLPNDSNYRTWKSADKYAYNGTLDGADHSIKGLYANSKVDGLIKTLDKNGVIKNINIANSFYEKNINDHNGIAYDNYGQILNCSMINTMFCSGDGNGVCQNNYGTIDNFYFSSDTILNISYGNGICKNNYGTIKNCENNSYVETSTLYCGISTLNEGTIDNCINNTPSSDGDGQVII